MSLFVAQQVTSVKRRPSPEFLKTPPRKIQPSPEAVRPRFSLEIRTPASETDPVDCRQSLSQLQSSLRDSNNVNFDFCLVHDGRAANPTREQVQLLLSIFPGSVGIEIAPPYIKVRVKQLPPKPWPFTLAGLVLRLTTTEATPVTQDWKIGRAAGILTDRDFNVTAMDPYQVALSAIKSFAELHVCVHTLIWCGDYWRATVARGSSLGTAPSTIAKQLVWYRFESDVPRPDPSAMRLTAPLENVYDNSVYVTNPTSIVRPGIMLSPSFNVDPSNPPSHMTWRSTTSGVLIQDASRQAFVTVAAHGFNPDSLVYHPTPANGMVIGRVVKTLDNLDISLVKLNPGLQYTNEFFSSLDGQPGPCPKSFVSKDPPTTRVYDRVFMDNPFGGRSEGMVTGLGVTVEGSQSTMYVPHVWYQFDNPLGVVDGSCGSAIVNERDEVLSFFRSKHDNEDMCYGVAAEDLSAQGYQVLSGEYMFQ